MNGFRITALSFFLSPVAFGATVAVIDSGVDYKHQDLSPRIWTNPGETAANQLDDDDDGYIDDVYGWNFADQNNEIIDYQYLNTFSDDCYKYFAIQGKVLLGTATDEDKAWIASKRDDQTFMSDLETFANFVHGTHVAGIASTSRSTERLIAAKIIPTKT